MGQINRFVGFGHYRLRPLETYHLQGRISGTGVFLVDSSAPEHCEVLGGAIEGQPVEVRPHPGTKLAWKTIQGWYLLPGNHPIGELRVQFRNTSTTEDLLVCAGWVDS